MGIGYFVGPERKEREIAPSYFERPGFYGIIYFAFGWYRLVR